jgi:type I restriction enzyme S subunit
MPEWRVHTLSEVYDFASGLSKPRSEFGSGFPFLSFKDVFYNRFVPKALDNLVQSSDAERKKCSIKRGDVFLTRTSETMDELGMSCVSLSNVPDATFNGFTKRLRPKDENYILPEYAGYFFSSPYFRQSVNAMSTMSTRASLNNDMLSRLEIVVPEQGEQLRIANVLKPLDDKIELNRQMNETLEEMARALFRDWFVDFGPIRRKMEGATDPSIIMGSAFPPDKAASLAPLFPSKLGADGLPERWVTTRTEDVALKIAMGPFGSNIKVSTFVDAGVPIISGHHLHGTFLKHGDHKFITEEHADRLKNSNVFEGDIIFTHAGTIGQVSMIGSGGDHERFVVSQRQFFLRPDQTKVSPFFLLMFYKSAKGQHELLANASQVGVPSIARPSSHLKSIEFCLPAMEVMTSFENTVGPLFAKMAANEQGTQTLAKMRDLLLPKLMSGEIRLANTGDEL